MSLGDSRDNSFMEKTRAQRGSENSNQQKGQTKVVIVPQAETKMEGGADPMALADSCSSHRDCGQGAGTHPGGCVGGWASLSDDKSLTRSQESCPGSSRDIQERWRSLLGSAKSLSQFCAVFILLGKWTLWTWTVWRHDPAKAKAVHKYGLGGGSKGRRGKGSGWGDTKQKTLLHGVECH